MPRRIKYRPHLVAISEAATLSKGKESPIAEVETASPLIDAVAVLTTGSECGHSHSAKGDSIDIFVHSVSEETRGPSTLIKKGQPGVSKIRNRYGRSILHNAVRKGDKKAIKTILETTPVLLHQVDNRGNHPLHYAASLKVPDGYTIVYMLLMAGAFVNALNDRLQSPLLLAVISNDSDDDTVSRILLFHNAKPAIKVTENLMLSQYASSRGLHKIATAIHEYM